MTSNNSTTRLVGHQEWQGALYDLLRHGDGGPVIFFVDDDVLKNLSPGSPDPAADLSDAVRAVVNPAAGARMFDRAMDRLEHWAVRSQAEPPPVLPILALSVVAGSRMINDGVISSTNYYARLADLVCQADGRNRRDDVAARMRSTPSENLTTMWISFDRWIRWNQDWLGRSTIQTDQRLRRIGYPLSQTLVCARDRATLREFFRAMGNSIVEASPEDMLRRLDRWNTNGFSRMFHRALEDPELRKTLGLLVSEMADDWDATVPDESRPDSATISIELNAEDWELHWSLIWQNGPTQLDLEGRRAGVAHTVTASRSGRRYSLEGLPEVRHVGERFSLRGPGVEASFPGYRSLFFPQIEQGTALLTEDPLIGREYFALIRETEVTEFHRIFDPALARGWKDDDQGDGDRLIPGFRLVEHVRTIDPERWRDAFSEWTGGAVRATSARPRLSGGLSIGSENGVRRYLLGGEPDLKVPVAEGCPTYVLSIDGVCQKFKRNGRTQRFSKLPLAVHPGVHVVAVDGVAVSRFEVVDPGGVGSLPNHGDELGPCAATERTSPVTGSGGTRRVGAEGQEPSNEPRQVTVFPADSGTWILRSNGAAVECRLPDESGIRKRFGFDPCDPPMAALSVSSQDVWVIQRWGKKWRVLVADGDDRREWTYGLEDNPIVSWERYCSRREGRGMWERLLRRVR